jgi:hypothetical protein
LDLSGADCPPAADGFLDIEGVNLNSPNRRMRTRTSCGVGGVRQGEPAVPTRSCVWISFEAPFRR